MILLAAYAFGVWFLAVRFRRHWTGYAAVVVGVIALLLLIRPAMGESALGSLMPVGMRSGLRQLSALVVPEAALIALVGFFVASLPRRPGPGHCDCGYDLRGLSSPDSRCPECGVRGRADLPALTPPGPSR